MADDDQNTRDKVLLLEAITLLTVLVTSIGRQVNDLKYVVFRQTLSDEEYQKTRDLQEDVFKNTDQVLAKLQEIKDQFSHGR
jgi:hypothetical protein